MHNLIKADEIYQELKSEGKLVDEMFRIFKEKMPEAYCKLMHLIKSGCHIYDEEMYNEAISHLEWANGKGKGAKWDVDTIDWKYREQPDVIINRVKNKDVKDGSIILMHPTKATMECVDDIIEVIRSKGLKPGKLSDIFK